jgi:hypothetical protein
VLLCAAAWLCASAQAVLVDHKVLFITVGSSASSGDFIKLALDGYGGLQGATSSRYIYPDTASTVCVS